MFSQKNVRPLIGQECEKERLGRTIQAGSGEELSGASRGTTSALAAGGQGKQAAPPSPAFGSGLAWEKPGQASWGGAENVE